MESEQEHDKVQIEEASPEPIKKEVSPVPETKPIKNQKRVEAGKKLVEHNKKAKEKMLEDIAMANANANEAKTILKDYLDKVPKPPAGNKLQEYQTPIIISGALLIAALYIWSSKQQEEKIPSQPVPVPTNVNAVDVQGHKPAYDDDIFKI